MVTNWMKSEDVIASYSYTISSKSIFNLCAPGAEKFENPLELSYSVLSSSGVITRSTILNPTLAEGKL